LADVEAAQRLRFQVFNLELGEGLEASYSTGLDEDAYDLRCHHLLVEHQGSGQVVGTYRLMTKSMAGPTGFYSEAEFHLETLPLGILDEGLELGRACVASDHRSGRVIYLLWKGIAQYMAYNRLRYLFGCCSVPATDPGVGLKLHAQLAREGHLMDGVFSHATRSCSCLDGSAVSRDVAIPPLFRVYLEMGAKVCSEPAIDRQFGVIDFLIVLDLEELDGKTHKRLFGGGPATKHQREPWFASPHVAPIPNPAMGPLIPTPSTVTGTMTCPARTSRPTQNSLRKRQ
jgi:putative hemolysin